MIHPKVTILVPNYKTPQLTTLCLRLIRKFTDPNLIKVIVIDNDSQDASVDYLRSLKWIELIERKTTGEIPAIAHARALDAALERVTTPYVLSFHTDSFVKRPDWLPFLLSQIEKNPNVAGVGSWKLESRSYWKRFLKAVERCIQLLYYKLMGNEDHSLEGVGRNFYYLRSHCALYRMDLLRKYHLQFSVGEMVAGKAMHKALVDAGHQMVFLPNETLIKYIDHVNHATTVLNPQLGSRGKNIKKGLRRIKKSLASVNADEMLKDASFDQ